MSCDASLIAVCEKIVRCLKSIASVGTGLQPAVFCCTIQHCRLHLVVWLGQVPCSERHGHQFWTAMVHVSSCMAL